MSSAFNAAHINAFVAAAEVLRAAAQASVTGREALFVERGTVAVPYVMAVVAVSGEWDGTLFMWMDEAVALRVCGAMLQEPVSEFDDMCRSAIGELCNMIAGAAATKLEQLGLHARIAPPAIVTGTGGEL